jgi:hypothetical protein
MARGMCQGRSAITSLKASKTVRRPYMKQRSDDVRAMFRVSAGSRWQHAFHQQAACLRLQVAGRVLGAACRRVTQSFREPKLYVPAHA